MNHASTGHKGDALTGLKAQFFRGLGRGVCEGCGHLRRHVDLQCARCRVTTLARETREGDVVAAASSGGHIEKRARSRTWWKTLLEPGKVFAETCVAGIVFCRRVALAVGRQRRRACPALPQDFVGRCEALGLLRWCTSLTQLVRSCVRSFAAGWRGCSTATATGARSCSVLTFSCLVRFQRGKIRRLSCGRG